MASSSPRTSIRGGGGGRDGDVADRPRRASPAFPRRSRGRGGGRHRDTCPPSRCPASTSTPRTSTCCGYWVDLDEDPAGLRPRPAGARQPRQARSSSKLNEHGVEVTFEDAVAKAGAADCDRPSAHRPGRRRRALTSARSSRSTWSRAPRRSSSRQLAERRAGRRADPRRRRRGRRRPPLLGRHGAGSGPRPGREPRPRRRPRRHRDLLPAAHEGADAALPRALRGVRPRPDRARRTSTARPTRRSRGSARTTRTGWASRRFPRGPKRHEPRPGLVSHALFAVGLAGRCQLGRRDQAAALEVVEDLLRRLLGRLLARSRSASSGFSGGSYGSEMPVNSLISPERALA